VTQYAFGHALQIVIKGDRDFRFQNFFIGKNMMHTGADGTNAAFQFVPFGFSGVTVNRTGDGLEASVVFPNNELTRSWGVKAIENSYRMMVQVLIIENTNPGTDSTVNSPGASVVHTYTGVVTGGQWDNVSFNLELSSVLDAVGTDVPRRSLTQRIVGNLPISNSVRLQ
tara:strand:- start:570 stop:1076 length:507 start_codon:yes stop_codon:yes gene_type:complete